MTRAGERSARPSRSTSPSAPTPHTPTGDELAVHAAWSALAELYQSVVRPVVATLEADTGLDSGTYSALAYLERATPPGRLPLSDLGTLMAVRYSQSGLSRLVQRMEADGLVERRPHPTDRRASVVVITRSGRARHRAARTVYDRAVADALGPRVAGGVAERLRRACDAALTHTGE